MYTDYELAELQKPHKYIIQRAVTKNDAMGNPRRIYVVYRSPDGPIIAQVGSAEPERFEYGVVCAVFDEGYLGRIAVPLSFRNAAIFLPDINITPKEYNRLKRIETNLTS
jgi:hypothetical protein